MRVAANLTTMFQECGTLIKRYDAAAAAGFKLVECAFPYSESLEALVEKKERLHLEQVLINAPPGQFGGLGDFASGDRGIACIPERSEEFRRSIDTAITYARGLRCPRIHIMAGMPPSEVLRVQAEQTYVENIKYASERMALVYCSLLKENQEGITCLIEPINRFSIPGYFLFSYDQGHIQIAQVPERHEPDSPGELQYSYVFDLLKDMNSDNIIGCEYIPTDKTADGLGWIQKFGLDF